MMWGCCLAWKTCNPPLAEQRVNAKSDQVAFDENKLLFVWMMNKKSNQIKKLCLKPKISEPGFEKAPHERLLLQAESLFSCTSFTDVCGVIRVSLTVLTWFLAELYNKCTHNIRRSPT